MGLLSAVVRQPTLLQWGRFCSCRHLLLPLLFIRQSWLQTKGMLKLLEHLLSDKTHMQAISTAVSHICSISSMLRCPSGDVSPRLLSHCFPVHLECLTSHQNLNKSALPACSITIMPMLGCPCCMPGVVIPSSKN